MRLLLFLVLLGLPLYAWADAAVEGLCGRISDKLASVGLSECLDSRLLPTGAQSVSGAPILMREYPPLPGRTPQARILLFGGIHGDEYSSVSIIFKWMRTLDAHHSGLFHWHVIPLLNPDGLLRQKSQRMNQNGVDLNRNFPTADWDKESRHYWEKETGRDPRRFPGTGPASEPESRFLVEEIERFKPDAIISVHAPFGILDFDGPPAKPPKRLGHLYLSLLGTYPGSLGRYGWVRQGIPVVTIELPHAGIMPSNGEISQIWIDLVRWLVKNIDHSATRPQPMEP